MKRIIPILIVMIVLSAGYWWYSQLPLSASLISQSETGLLGSGLLRLKRWPLRLS